MRVVTSAAGATPSTAPASAPQRQANMTGTLQLQQQGVQANQGPPLLLGLEAVLDTQRLVKWQYNSSKAQFVTQVDLNGTWQVAAAGATTTSVAVSGTLHLVSPGWPGPGFTGKYTWAGDLNVSPNPWSLVTTPGASHRRQLLAGVSVSVSGAVVVTEVAPVTVPSLLQDTMRGDNLNLLDADGSVVVVGAAALPTSALAAAPAWKQSGVATPRAVPVSGYTGAAIAGMVVGGVAAGVVVLSLAVFGFYRLSMDAKRVALQEP